MPGVNSDLYSSASQYRATEHLIAAGESMQTFLNKIQYGVQLCDIREFNFVFLPAVLGGSINKRLTQSVDATGHKQSETLVPTRLLEYAETTEKPIISPVEFCLVQLFNARNLYFMGAALVRSARSRGLVQGCL
jgi:hypothetical protein